MLSKLFNTVIFVFVFEVLAVSCDSHNSTFLNKRSRHRQKRTLNFYFPYNSCYAVSNVSFYEPVLRLSQKYRVILNNTFRDRSFCL